MALLSRSPIQRPAAPFRTGSGLPPHLREVCDILARGMLRLRSRTAEHFNRDLGVSRESSLHFPAHQSVHADPLERTSA
jgi:hypothetical protein